MFSYQYSVYQLEYSRNLVFHLGERMEQVFEGLLDRSRRRLDLKRLKTVFGRKARPRRERVIETRQYDLTVFKLHCGKLTVKAYSKGERVLRFEAVAHNTKQLRCGRELERFPQIVSRLRGLVERFLNNLSAMDRTFVSDSFLERLAEPSQVGATRVGGVDLQQPRMRTTLWAVLSLACGPAGFRVGELAAQVKARAPGLGYGVRQAAYDLKKLRGKNLVHKKPGSRRYEVPPAALRQIGALVILREKVLQPILAGLASRGEEESRTTGRPSTNTMKRSENTCLSFLTTWASPLSHRQSFVDVVSLSA